MKKTLACIFVTLFLCVILCSCAQQNVGEQQTQNDQAQASIEGQSVSSSNTDAQDTSTGNVPDYATLAEPKDGEEAISILSYTAERRDKYLTSSFVVRNDLEITVRDIYLSLVFLDEDGNIIASSNATDSVRVLPGQLITLKGTTDKAPNAVAVYVDSYFYRDKDDNRHDFYVDNPEIFPIQ